MQQILTCALYAINGIILLFMVSAINKFAETLKWTLYSNAKMAITLIMTDVHKDVKSNMDFSVLFNISIYLPLP